MIEMQKYTAGDPARSLPGMEYKPCKTGKLKSWHLQQKGHNDCRLLPPEKMKNYLTGYLTCLICLSARRAVFHLTFPAFLFWALLPFVVWHQIVLLRLLCPG